MKEAARLAAEAAAAAKARRVWIFPEWALGVTHYAKTEHQSGLKPQNFDFNHNRAQVSRSRCFSRSTSADICRSIVSNPQQLSHAPQDLRTRVSAEHCLLAYRPIAAASCDSTPLHAKCVCHAVSSPKTPHYQHRRYGRAIQVFERYKKCHYKEQVTKFPPIFEACLQV